MTDEPNFGDYDEKRFEPSPDETHEPCEWVDNRVISYIAFPMRTTTLLQVEDILWWGKTHSMVGEWMDNDEIYAVYRVYIKEPYLHHVTEELQQVNGFYLRRKEVD